MRLKTLKIAGFKSFADRIIITFDAPLIGIVGPNGCGKSNIVDAFRWVLGEQSARSLRGSQMHDVIFAGSSKRKPAQMAEVSVTLTDVKEGELSLPYGEVTITRRLYRDGRSEYLLNKQPSRLRDIQHLFLGTGVGRGVFSIFEQGKIDRIISLQPTARREIFDEAAGIGRFLERKKETLRKLNAMMENYNRLKDLHLEVDRQTKTLKRQAAAAEQFLKKKERLEALEQAILITKLKNLREGQSEQVTALTQLKQQTAQFSETLSKKEKELVEVKTQRKLHDEQVASLQEKVTAAARSAAMQEAQQQQQTKRREELLSRIDRLVNEATEKKALLDTHEKEVAAKKEELVDPISEKEVKTFEKAYLDGVEKQGKVSNDLQALSFRLEKMQEEEQRRIAEIESGQQRKEVLQGEFKVQKATVEALKEKVGANLKALKEVQSQLSSKIEAKKEKEEYVATLRNQKAQLDTTRSLLEKLKASRDGMSKGTQHLLKASQDAKHELYYALVPLTELIVPKKGEAKQLDAALARYKETLVASTQESFDKTLAYAKKHKIKDFSLVLKKKNLRDHFVKDATFSEEGHFIDAKEVLFSYGEMVDAPFQQAQKLQEVTQEVAKVEEELTQIDLEQLQKEVEATRKERNTLDEQHRKQEMHLVQENFAMQRFERDISEVETSLEKLRAKVKGDDGALVAQISEKKEALKQLTQDIPKLKERWQEAGAALTVVREKQHAIALAESQLGETKRSFERLDRQVEEAKKGLELCEEMLKRREHLLSKAESEALEEELKQKRAALKVLQEKQEACETDVESSKEGVHAIERKQHACEVKLAEESALDSNLTGELLERYSMSAEAALGSDIIVEAMDEAEKELKALRQSVEKNRSVNLTAIESYAEESKRFEELDTQLKDLIASKEDLEALIAKLDHQSRQLFKETFSQIKENFKVNFQTLFGGGEADLRFTESHDILEAGIEIIAKPPGKQMRSISLLSGGEKCLTALALLFSLFEVKPAPFCILDEVDAPLDETNVGRFTEMLGRYIEHTQFLTVTHNKKTMAASDRLIGVSMEEKGVSKLLSLTFSKKRVEV